MNWISIEKQVPNKHSKVAYKMKNGRIDFGSYNGKDFCTFDPISEDEITHWMYFDVYWNNKCKP